MIDGEKVDLRKGWNTENYSLVAQIKQEREERQENLEDYLVETEVERLKRINRTIGEIADRLEKELLKRQLRK